VIRLEIKSLGGLEPPQPPLWIRRCAGHMELKLGGGNGGHGSSFGPRALTLAQTMTKLGRGCSKGHGGVVATMNWSEVRWLRWILRRRWRLLGSSFLARRTARESEREGTERSRSASHRVPGRGVGPTPAYERHEGAKGCGRSATAPVRNQLKS